MRRMVLFGALVAAMVVAAGVLGTSMALAYGKGTVAQVEFSGNCHNTTWCGRSVFGGTGGIWIWATPNNGGRRFEVGWIATEGLRVQALRLGTCFSAGRQQTAGVTGLSNSSYPII
jgi:hypothetical protein